jgi:hypothetical protein
VVWWIHWCISVLLEILSSSFLDRSNQAIYRWLQYSPLSTSGGIKTKKKSNTDTTKKKNWYGTNKNIFTHFFFTSSMSLKFLRKKNIIVTRLCSACGLVNTLMHISLVRTLVIFFPWQIKPSYIWTLSKFSFKSIFFFLKNFKLIEDVKKKCVKMFLLVT